ncbi:MAG: HEPN domain-containing protein [Candidatus Bipolaricaulota bacterium]|nr:HEPN domain-containing protein [Candidatus Bipolaricaulota bacterium]
MNRYRDWLDQARADLDHARKSVALGDYAWVCFAAHQAAKAATKGLHSRRGQIAWGHSVAALLRELPDEVRLNLELMDAAKALDRHYIPTRDPDAHPAGSAGDNYSAADAEAAVSFASRIVDHCERASLDNRS